MKTLDQIEPRTPISTVGQTVGSGSYYLAANLTATGAVSGIVVGGSDVTIDLNGFELTGVVGSNTGILINGSLTNVTIRNGTIRNWGTHGIDGAGNARVRVENVRVMNNGGGGIIVDVNGVVRDCVAQSNVGPGIKATDNCLIENCQAISNTGLAGTRILTGDSCSVDRCISRSNAGYGVSTGQYCTLTNCAASSNSQHGFITAVGCNLSDCNGSSNMTNGFAVGAKTMVRHCVANSNGGNGINADYGTTLVNCAANENRGDAGIHTSNGCTVIGCAASFNTSTLATSAGITVNDNTLVSQCTVIGSDTTAAPTASTGMGINVSASCSVERCTAASCKGDGIRAAIECSIIANKCDGNGVLFGSVAAGIHTTFAGNRIEGNNVAGNILGIQVEGTGSLILKNSAQGSVTNYSIVAGNRYGTIVNIPAAGTAAANGNSAASTLTSTDPWANFAY